MFMPRRKKLAISLGVLSILGVTGIAHGVVVGFECITQNDAGNAAIGQQQLSMDVTSPQEGQAAFTFYSVGQNESTIAQIYVERGPLADLVSIVGSAGVSFQEGGSPKSLPGGSGLEPAFDPAFRVTAANPAPRNGINNTSTMDKEWVTLVFGLSPGKCYTDVLRDLANDQLRVGLHVQNFADGGSEAFRTTSNVPVPEPATVGFGLAALLGVALARRPRRLASAN